jgi:ribosomal protein S2
MTILPDPPDHCGSSAMDERFDPGNLTNAPFTGVRAEAV